MSNIVHLVTTKNHSVKAGVNLPGGRSIKEVPGVLDAAGGIFSQADPYGGQRGEMDLGTKRRGGRVSFRNRGSGA